MKCLLPDCESDAYPGQDYCSSDHRDRAQGMVGLLDPCSKCGGPMEVFAMNIEPWVKPAKVAGHDAIVQGQTKMEMAACRKCHPKHFEASK